MFIYWTADGYATTGCYNLDCPGFVQTSEKGVLGGAFSQYSVSGGAQYQVGLGYFYYSGNWWLTRDNVWIGYFPGSLYNNGPMTSGKCEQIQFGTESVGNVVWPGEGSGNWSSSGYSYAAFQNGIYYVDFQGSNTPASLSAYQPSPNCYSITGPTNGGGNWSVYFYEGGPGGRNC